jgi:hypothetical protein
VIGPCQRWRDRRGSYRHPGEVIDTSAHEVAPIAHDTTARAFVEQHHYSGSYPAARFRFGLYRGPELVGVAVFSHPVNNKTLTSVFPGEATDSVELGRFVLLDGVPGNGETWFLARCFAALRAEGLNGVVSFSDPLARTDASGNAIFGGHVGTIYQASNGVYLGRGTARTLRLLPSGRVLNDRAIQKVRARERGWRYVVADVVAAGAPEPGDDLDGWLRMALPAVTRTFRHPGNHKYAWALARAARRALPASLPYPKLHAPAF